MAASDSNPPPLPPQVTLLSDHPAEEGLDALPDLLGLEGRLATIFDILRHRETRCPMSMAIYGDWGTGKISAMRWLAQRLRAWNEQKPHSHGHPCVHPVWFDPWNYREREDVVPGITDVASRGHRSSGTAFRHSP